MSQALNNLDYVLVKEWNGGFKSELFFTPVNNTVQGWRIEFNADFDIRGIWGAKVISHEGDRLIIGPQDDNKQYSPGNQSKITIVADTDPGETSTVENLTFYNSADDLGEIPPTITQDENPNNFNDSGLNYDVVEQWPGGFKSELFFSPETSVQGWRIELDADFDIRGIWGAKVISHEGDRLIIGSENDHTQLQAGSDHLITIVADTDPGETSTVDNLTFYNSAEDLGDVPPVTTEDENPNNNNHSGNEQIDYGTGQFRYGKAIQKSFLFYEAQRSGDLPNDNRIEWRGDSAMGDGSDVGLNLTGGYYDAGDHVKFGMPMALSMTSLAWGGIEYKTAYKNMGQWDELLDTVKWGTDWIQKAHITENGQTKEVYVQSGDGYLDHSVWAPAETMTMNRPSLKINSNNPGSDIASDYAAALASASMLFKGENDAYANQLLNEAKQLYEFAETYVGKYSDSVPGVNPYYTSWSGYEDELIWGATWLYKATGEQQYLDKAKQYAQQYGINPGHGTLSWDDKTAGALILLAQTGDTQYVNSAKNWLDSWMPGGNVPTYTSGGFAWKSRWGSLRTTANTAFLAGIYHDTIETNPSYHDFATQQIDYILGDNPRNSSYVVGFGNNPPERAHHRSASGHSFNNVNFKSTEPNDNILYGALVGGPKSANDWDWQDDRGDAVGNEVALDYNAGYTGALAYLYDKFGGDPLTEAELDALAGIDVAGI